MAAGPGTVDPPAGGGPAAPPHPSRGVEAALLPVDEVEVLLPIVVGDYVDFYSSLHHAGEPGPHVPARRRARCSPTGATCPSPTTGGPARCGSAATDVVRPEGLVPDARRRAPARPPAARSTSSSRWASWSGHGGHPDPARRRRRPRVRRRAPQRLVGPGHPGLRVPAARAQPGQELRHDDLAVGRHARRAAARTSSPARTRTRRPTRTCRCNDRGPSTSTSRWAQRRTRSAPPGSGRCTGRSRSSSPT